MLLPLPNTCTQHLTLDLTPMRHSLQLLKYGVVATEALCSDLRHWSQLYIAGRLHKPVVHVK